MQTIARLYCLGDNGRVWTCSVSCAVFVENIFHLQLAESTDVQTAGLKFQLYIQTHTLNAHTARIQMDTSLQTEELPWTLD